MLFASILFHPVRFISEWREGRRLFDRNGRPRPGSGVWGDPELKPEDY